MSIRIALKNLGCRLNRVELDDIARQLEQQSCLLVQQSDADIVVINSCAVTGEAEAKCRKAIRHAVSLPQKPTVIVCGCLVNLSRDDVEALGERVVCVPDKSEVAHVILSRHIQSKDEDLNDSRSVEADTTPSQVVEPALTPTPTGRTRPGVKIQDGCNNRCTFCVVWKARGTSISYAPDMIIDRIKEAQMRGAREIVLSGINLGSYAYSDEKSAPLHLPNLLDRLLSETSIERIRLSSIEPPDVDEHLIEIMSASKGRIAPYLHMCLQSGCDATLKRMGRVYDTALYRERAEMARRSFPHLALGCDVIVGFPGETEKDFVTSFEFCEEMSFARMHIFRFSARPGTPAANMPNQVDPLQRAARAQQMKSLADGMRAAYAQSLLGIPDGILIQAPGRGVNSGLMDVVVDTQYAVGSLVDLTPHTLLKNATLDARTI